jgi:hypothetical protein
MKKYILALVLIISFGFLFFTKKGNVVKSTVLSYVTTPDYVKKGGNTVATRILVPDGYTRAVYEADTFPK